MKKKLNFVVVGCGRMGIRRMKSIIHHKDAKLLYAVDPDIQLKDKIENEFKCKFHSDYRIPLKQDDVNCVIVSVPNIYHKEIVEYALEKRKHVWCEKPLARNPIEAKHMVERSE